MQQASLTYPELALLGGTRVALGAGVGLLVSNKFNQDQRKAAGWVLFAVGALTTIPIVLGILAKRPQPALGA
jgi:hypothetical protein